MTSGEPGRLVITGAVTVRVGWDVPANAADLARFARDFADDAPAFFIVTDLRSLRDQPDLERWLGTHADLVRRTLVPRHAHTSPSTR